MGMVRFLNSLICTLGCIAVMAAIGVLLWLPTEPWARAQVFLTRDARPIMVSVTGYEALMLANGLAVGPTKIAIAAGALSGQEGGANLLTQFEMSDRLQAQIRNIAVQTQPLSNIILPLQIALFVLPALTLFLAVIVMFSRDYFGQQLLKGVVLIMLTLLTVTLIAGLTQVASERLSAVIAASHVQNAAGFPGLGVTVNDALPELHLDLMNLIDNRTPLIAGGVAIIGSIVALLGAGLSSQKPAMSQAQFTRAAMQSGGIVDVSPPAPTQRLTHSPSKIVSKTTNPTCASCGQPLGVGEKFCRSCGAKLV